MKYLLVITFVLVVFWVWRHNRQAKKDAAAPRAKATPAAGITEIVACEVCQVHLPRSEALIGGDGFYCSEAHRREAGDR
ncbi:MAG: hypothetical protein JWR60_1485 [Polaromonas sp.]|nr:hypothetical protein [Polaromonas sp.]